MTDRWIQLRCGRRFYCDTSQLEADYRAERSEMLEAIHKLAGRLQVGGEAIDRLKFDQDAAGRLNAMDGGVRRYLLAEALSSAVLAWISAMGPKEPAQEAAKKLESCWKGVADKDSAAVLFGARLACAAAAVEPAALGARALPNELCDFDFEQFNGYYKRASRAMTLFWLC